MQKLRKPNEGETMPGAVLVFRGGGDGPVRAVRVLPRGPHGQFMVEFLDGPAAGHTLATGWRELFIDEER